MRFANIFLVVSVLFGFSVMARAGEDPVLRIEAGMHIAPIVTMATDAANRLLATGSEDKTIRLWSLPGARPGAILRIPVGAGDIGKIYAVAVSPDGATVAVGGWTTADREENIYLLDSRTGAFIRRLTGLPDVTTSLAFSPDGQFLAAGLGGRHGIVVYDAGHGWDQTAADTEYDGVVRSLAFDTTGRLAASCSDGDVRLYAPGQFDRPHARRHLDGRPAQVAFSPQGGQLAVALADRPKVEVLSAATLAPLFTPDVSGIDAGRGGFDAVTWSAHGDVLVAGGSARVGADAWLRRWSQGGRGGHVDLPAANDTVRALVPLRDGTILFATMDPAIGEMTPAGAVHVLQASGKLDFRARTGPLLTANKDGDSIDAGAVFPVQKLAVSLRDRAVGLDAVATPDTPPADIGGPGLSITGWRDGRTPALNGTPLALLPHETARALAVASDGGSFLLGTSWRLIHFDATGQELWAKPTEAAVWNLAETADGRVAVLAQGDGTIRWRRLSDGAELLAVFVTPDARRWVAWTPSGYYDASPGGESLIGWQVDHGPDTAPTFHPAWQFRERFYRPDVVSRILDTLDETKALGTVAAPAVAKAKSILTKDADQAIPAAAATIAGSTPPTVAILDSPDRSESPQIELQVSITPAPADTETVAVRAMIDGHRVAPSFVKSKGDGLELMGLVIPDGIPDKKLGVTVVATDSQGQSAPVTAQVEWRGSAAHDQKPALFVLAVGVAKYLYLGAGAALQFSGRDAQAFANALMAQKGREYSDVQTMVLIDEQATLTNIKNELADLRKQMRERDVAIVFLSGHGAPPREDWAFLPYDGNPDNEDSELTGDYLNRRIDELPGIKFLFLDTCFSGAALRDHGLHPFRSPRDENPLINALTTEPSGVVVFSSSMGDQLSYEDSDSHHGAYTEALLEALAGKAGGPQLGMYALEDYLDRRVRALTEQKQTPTITSSYGMPNQTLAVVP